MLDGDPTRKANDTMPHYLAASLDGYALSKFISEELVRKAVQEHNLTVRHSYYESIFFLLNTMLAII